MPYNIGSGRMQHVYHPYDTLDGYLIVEHLADGAFAAVYRAVPTKTADGPEAVDGPDCDVALKIPHPFVLDRPALATRWRREVALTACLDHPNIQRQLHAGAPRSYPYLVLEYSSRGTVRSWLTREGPVPWQRALVWGTQLAEVLAYLHGLGIVHRDLKPDNLLLSNATDALDLKLGDFGSAVRLKRRLVRLPTAVVDPLEGTPDYLSPEQLKGEPGCYRSDLYSWGIVMYELLTGSSPFVSNDPPDHEGPPAGRAAGHPR
jgi:serine/threonine-protein kinase